jgi:hypothetical protein
VGIASLYPNGETLGWKDQNNKDGVVFASGNPTLAQNARVGHPRFLSQILRDTECPQVKTIGMPSRDNHVNEQ